MSRRGAVFAGLVAAILMAPSALATVPGPNGLIAFRADTGNGNGNGNG